MVFDIIHTTRYKYEDGATFCHNLATLKPKNCIGQQLLDYNLKISPTPNEFSERVDFFGNTITRFSIQEYHKELEVTAESKVYRNYEEQVASANLKSLKAFTIEIVTVDPKDPPGKRFFVSSQHMAMD